MLAGLVVDLISIQALYVGAGALLVLAGVLGLGITPAARKPVPDAAANPGP